MNSSTSEYIAHNLFTQPPKSSHRAAARPVHSYAMTNIDMKTAAKRGGTTDDCPQELRLANQLCFPLYACAKEVVRAYQPLLEPLGLTYTQYVCMMVLWEEGEITQRELGQRIWLDSGTLSPLLKCLQAKGYVELARTPLDVRVQSVRLTPKGLALRERAVSVPRELVSCIDLPAEDTQDLYRLLHKLLDTFRS